MEKGYWWCRRKRQRAGVLLTVGTKPDGSPDERWCFRSVRWAGRAAGRVAGLTLLGARVEGKKLPWAVEAQDVVTACSVGVL